MSRRGNCRDNTVAESFSSLKKEASTKRIYKTRDMARADTFVQTEWSVMTIGEYKQSYGKVN